MRLSCLRSVARTKACKLSRAQWWRGKRRSIGSICLMRIMQRPLSQMLFGMLYVKYAILSLSLNSIKSSYWIGLLPIMSLSHWSRTQSMTRKARNNFSKSSTTSLLKLFTTACITHIQSQENHWIMPSWGNSPTLSLSFLLGHKSTVHLMITGMLSSSKRQTLTAKRPKMHLWLIARSESPPSQEESACSCDTVPWLRDTWSPTTTRPSTTFRNGRCSSPSVRKSTR